MSEKISVTQEEKPPIHKDFKLHFMHFWQNKEWNRELVGGEPQLKAIFSFDDSELLNDCPFVCKISFDQKQEHKYFGVAYEREENLDFLKKWACKFQGAKILTYEGSFISNV